MLYPVVCSAGETLLADAIHMTAKWGLVQPNDHVVVIQMLHDSLTIKIVSVDEYGRGIASVQPQSLKDMIEARLFSAARRHKFCACGRTL